MSDGSRAVALLNRTGAEAEIAVNWTELGYPEHFKAAVRDLWEHASVGSHKGGYSAQVPSHGVVVLTVMPE